MERNPTIVNIVESLFLTRDRYLSDHRLYTEDSGFTRHNNMHTDKMLANVNIVIKHSLVIGTYVYIWECTQGRDHISTLIVKTSDISDTLYLQPI